MNVLFYINIDKTLVTVVSVGLVPSCVLSGLRYNIYLTAIGLTPGGSSTHLHTNNT